MLDLVLGSYNAKKLAELREWLPEDPIGVRSLAEVRGAIEVEENGETFAANAAKKAIEQAEHLAVWVLAEDSGLSVDALDGRPGVHSARYAGEHGDDEANNDQLLEELEGVPESRRSAHYTCCLCLADPEGRVVLEASGTCSGRIATERRGSAGFGYDPLFEIPEYHRTFGELGQTAKRALSHRSRALRRFLPELLRLVETTDINAG